MGNTTLITPDARTRPWLSSHEGRLDPDRREWDAQDLGFGWGITKSPLFRERNGKPEHVEEAVEVQRSDTGQHLGIVTPKWKPIENEQLAALVNATLAGEPDLSVVAAGTMNDSRRVWVVAESAVTVVAGDMTIHNLLFSCRHDGSGSLGVTPFTTRLECTNQLPGLFSKRRLVSVRHTSGADTYLQAAQQTLGQIGAWRAAYNEAATMLATSRLDTDRAHRHLAAAIPDPANGGKVALRNRDELRGQIIENWRQGDNLQNHRGTGWGLLQSTVECLDWATPRRRSTSTPAWERRMNRQLGITDATSIGIKLHLATRLRGDLD